MPEISVVLPVFNAERTIKRALQSILEQSLKDIEVIVVNDGSTDGTSNVLRSVNDSRVQCLQTPHQGVAMAMNDGVSIAQAPLIARMDSDDVSHPDRLKHQMSFLNQHDVDVVGCQVRIVDQAGATVESMARYQNWINEETLTEQEITAYRFVELPIVNPTILARRAYFELKCLDSKLPEDYDLMLRAAEKGFRFGKVPKVLFDWIDSHDRLTRNDNRYSIDAFMNCRRHHLLGGPLREQRQVKFWGVGKTGKPWIRWLQEQGVDIEQAIEVSPRKIGQTVHGVVVEPPDALSNFDGTVIVIAVGASGARPLIRQHLLQHGYRPGIEAWFVA